MQHPPLDLVQPLLRQLWRDMELLGDISHRLAAMIRHWQFGKHIKGDGGVKHELLGFSLLGMQEQIRHPALIPGMAQHMA
ncbi:hypothetical protein D3C81_1056870 [compost metagenome]